MGAFSKVGAAPPAAGDREAEGNQLPPRLILRGLDTPLLPPLPPSSTAGGAAGAAPRHQEGEGAEGSADTACAACKAEACADRLSCSWDIKSAADSMAESPPLDMR